MDLKKYLNDALSLLFPEICQACKEALYMHESVICNKCLLSLPETNFHQMHDNEIEKIFWGRCEITAASAFLYFNKGNKTQELIHKLKYKGRTDIGEMLGRLYGEILYTNNHYKLCTQVVPVPLHPHKLQQRGYNQSEFFAKGIASSLGISVNTTLLKRKTASATQTKKSRFERWKNVAEIFETDAHQVQSNEHILLVDDVITTGATAEACIGAIRDVLPVKISFAAIAYANS